MPTAAAAQQQTADLKQCHIYLFIYYVDWKLMALKSVQYRKKLPPACELDLNHAE